MFTQISPQQNLIQNQDPLFETLICHFNTRKSPVLIAGQGYVPFWSLTIFDQKSNQIFSTTQMATNQPGPLILVGNPLQFLQLKTIWPDFHKGNQVPLYTYNGYAVLRIARLNKTWEINSKNFINSAFCDVLFENSRN